MKMNKQQLKILFVGVVCTQIALVLLFAKINYSGQEWNILDILGKLAMNSSLQHSNSRILTSQKYIPKTSSSTTKRVLIHAPDSKCPQLPVPDLRHFRYKWRPVIYDDMSVYSAFLDGTILRMIGIIRLPMFAKNIECHVWYKRPGDTVAVLTSSVNIEVIPEGHGRTFVASYFKCQIPSNSEPFAVALTTQRCENSTHIIPVHMPGKTKHHANSISICVPPFNFRYGRAYELVQWIELNLMLGIEHFIFYNHSSNTNVKAVLDKYAKSGIVDVLQWDIPVHVDEWPPSGKEPEIHYFGQIASVNDCLYRNKGNFKYTAFTDLDEFIIPHSEEDKTLIDLLQKLPNSAEYNFRSSYFRMEWPDTTKPFNGKDTAEQYRLTTLLKLERESKVFGHQDRSKMIVKPDSIQSIGVHQTWSKVGNTYKVAPKDALVHHYRNLAQPDDKVPRQDDDTMLKFKDALIKNVAEVWAELNNVPMDIPL